MCAPYLEKLKPIFLPWFIKHSSVHLTATPGHSSSVCSQFAVNVGGPKRRGLTDQSADLDAAEHRRITKIRGLENPEIWFFAKMAWKTTSGSVFHFILNSASRISSKGHKYRWSMPTTFWDIWRQVLIHLKIMQMSYIHFGIKIFVAFCRHTRLLP